MGDYGIKVTRTGYDVADAIDQQLSFSSAFNYLKVYATGTSNLTVPSGSGLYTATVAHSLSFIPLALCYMKATGGTTPPDETYELSQRISDNLGYSPVCHYSVDATNLTIYIPRNPDDDTSWTLRYYIFYNAVE